MPKLSELKSLAEFIVSDDIDKTEFLLYYNFCMSDLSPIVKNEKTMPLFDITSNDNEKDLPSDLFDIVTVFVTKSDGSRDLAEKVTIDNDLSEMHVGRDRKRIYGYSTIFSRWNRKIYIKSDLLDSDSPEPLTVTVRYYGSLPTLDHENVETSLDQSPPISEVHYHHMIANYIAFMYFTNSQDKEEASSQFQQYMLERERFKKEVISTRNNKRTSTSIKNVRR